MTDACYCIQLLEIGTVCLRFQFSSTTALMENKADEGMRVIGSLWHLKAGK
jgi:hypothetical protein